MFSDEEALEVQTYLRQVNTRLRHARDHLAAFDLLREIGAHLDLNLPGVIPDSFENDSDLAYRCMQLAGFPEKVFEFLKEIQIAPNLDPLTWESSLPYVVSFNEAEQRRNPEDRYQKQFRQTLLENGMQTLLLVPVRQPMGKLGVIGWGGEAPVQKLEKIADTASAELLDFSYRFFPFIKDLADEAPPKLEPTYLTKRELDCLKMIASGFHTPEISARLGISATTVRHYLDNCRMKLNARSITHAASLAVQYGQLGTIVP